MKPAPKSDEQYLAEAKDWPHILKMKLAILGALALKDKLKEG